MTLHYSKANFPDLTTITAPVTHRHTIPAAVIIVGPGGNWWNGGIGGFGLHGSSCIWPFCPPGGGRGDASGGGSSGNNPKSPSNPHDNQDSSGTGKSTDSRQSSTAPPSSSTSCGATAVASDCSVFCPIATGISATRPCSTTCYSNETGCSASGTTATTTATGAPSQQVCDQSCSLCNAPPPGVATPTARMGKRNLPTSLKSIDKEALSVPSKEIEKRTLPDPSDAVYGGNVASFILEEFKKADKIPLRIDSNHPSSALVRKFNNERVNLAVYGLYGCTSVLVVSNQGIWASHFWENPSFVNANRFQNEVLVALEDGDGTDDMPGIRRYTGFREFLNVAEVPQAIIVTPRVRTSLVVGNLLFGVQVNQISTTLRGLIPNSIPIVIEYVPTDARTSQSTDNPSGKMLVQFDPDQRQYEAKKDCPAVQQARVSVWSGDRLEKIHNIDWAAEPNHVTAASKGKRDTPACSQRTLASYLSTIQATTGPAGSSIAASGGVSSYSVTASDGFSISASSTSLRSSILTTLRSLTVTPSSDAKSPSSTLNIVMFSTKSPPTPSISSASSAPASAGACLASSLAPGLSKVPGCWGVPRCAYYIAADQGLPADTPNYCNCGGTTAPLLTHSGTTDCAYTTQPASNIPLGTLPGGSGKGSTTPASAPRVTTAASPKLVVPPPPYVTGKCNIHVWEGLGEIGQKSVYLEANITDAKGGLVGFKSGGLDWNVALDVNSKLANVMIVTAQSGISRSLRKREDRHLSKRVGSAPPTRPLFEKGTVQFAVGAQKWDTTSKQCTAGVWNNGNANDFFGSLVFGDKFLPSRQMDCKFDC
ncbi:MAG: hypothetical protein M1812_003973 [Candelaria pacifica]|nr:MAG: hypothetical protein M1812_003973 [Candelaria pacifica]